MNKLRADLRAALGLPAQRKAGTDLPGLRAALRGEPGPAKGLAKVRAFLVAEGEYGAKEQAPSVALVQEATGSRIVRVREVVCQRSEYPLE